MRNLKRALSLTLASVMLLGMMVVGSSAASYPDVEDTHNVEAIEVLQAIKVMVGDDNGNFGPDDQVNRAQMAVVMALLLDLDYDYYKGTNPFWDVPSWAEPYVAACYANGIVSGYNATTYGAGDPVTAVQAASMMMRALGYFQYQSDYKDGFELSTVKQASKISLFKDVNAAGNSAPLTRNQVAQLALNTLETGMVEAKKTTSDITVGSGDTAVSISGAVEYVYVTSDDNKINTAIDNVKATSIGTQNDSMILELGEKLFNGDLKKIGEKTNSNENEYDDFGRPSVTWTYKNDKIGTYAKENDLVATYTKKVSKGDIYSLLSSAVRSDLEKSSAGSNLTVTVDGQKICDNVDLDGNNEEPLVVTDSARWYVRNSSEAIYTAFDGSSRNGTLTEVYLDKDNNVDIVIVNTYVYQATSDYSSSRDDVKMAPVGDTSSIITLKAGELNLKGEDFNITDVKTDDYLLITATSTTGGADYEVQSVKVAEKLEGEVTGYADKDSVTIDGTTYSYSATTKKNVGDGVRDTTYTVGQNAIVVLDAYGYVIAVDEAVSSSSFVFVKEIGSNTGLGTKAVADAYFTDGTNEEISLDRVTVTNPDKTTTDYKNGSAIYGARVALGNKWYTYSVNSDGKYVLYGLTSGRANDSKAYAASRGYTQIVTSGKVDFLKDKEAIANDKTIMLVKDNEGDVTAYTGTANIPDIHLPDTKTATVYFSTNSKGYTEYAFVNLENTGASVVDGGDDTSFMYVLRFKDTMSGSNATRYFNYSVINPESGEEKKIPFDSDIFSGANPYQLRYKPRTNSDERITSLAVVPDEWNITNGKYFNRDFAGTVSYSNGSLKIGTTNFIVAGDSKITLVIVKNDQTKALMSDKGGDHEIYFETQPQTVESQLKNYNVIGKIAGATKSSTSSVIDTLYITVTDVGEGGIMGGDASDITGAMGNDNVTEVVVTDPVIDGNITASKPLTLQGNVTGGAQTISGSSNVELTNATVGGSGTLTVSAPATLSGAVSVAAGKTLSLATATLSGSLSGAGTVNVTTATVAADTTLNANSGDVTMTTATVAGTLNANDDVTIGTATVTGTINVAEGATLTVNTNATGAGKIVAAAEGAKIAVGSSANATDLLTMVPANVKFYDNTGAEITDKANLANKTFVWREAGWKQPVSRARAVDNGDAGWVESTYAPAAFDATKITVPTAAKTVAVDADVTVTITDSEDYATYTVASSDAAKATATVAEKVITIHGVAAGTANVTVTAKAKANEALTKTYTIPVTVTSGSSEPTKYTVTAEATGYDVSGITAEGYAKDDTVTIKLTQKTGATLAEGAKFTVTATGASNLEGTVTKAGVTKVDPEYAKDDSVTDQTSFEAVTAYDLYKKETDGSYTKVTTYDSTVTDYYKVSNTPKDAVKGEITITFTMPESNVSITAIAPKAASGT